VLLLVLLLVLVLLVLVLLLVLLLVPLPRRGGALVRVGRRADRAAQVGLLLALHEGGLLVQPADCVEEEPLLLLQGPRAVLVRSLGVGLV
jgi:hypothetical protein